MNDFDERLRLLVRTIGEAAPRPPSVPVASSPPRRMVPRGRVVALVAFGLAVLIFGTVRLFLSPGGDVTGTASVTVRHQVLDVTLVANLSCDQGAGAGTSTLRIETWADFTGGRFRQLATYQDGSMRDRIALGDANYPTETYARGSSPLVVPACGEDMLASDNTSGPNVLFFNQPTESPCCPGYRELGLIVPGEYLDSIGRPSTLYRWLIDGYATAEDGTQTPMHELTAWYVDPVTGYVLERVTEQSEPDRYDVRHSLVVTTDDLTEIDPIIFATEGYELEWSWEDGISGPALEAEAVESALRLGSAVIWPESPEPGGGPMVAQRFSAEVLGWVNALVTLDTGAGGDGPVWATLADGQGHELAVLLSPMGSDGWGILQVGEPTGLGVAALGNASVTVGAVPNTTRVTIYVTDSQGAAHAWQADLTEIPATVVLPGIPPWDIVELLLVYQDADGSTLTATGGRFGD